MNSDLYMVYYKKKKKFSMKETLDYVYIYMFFLSFFTEKKRKFL